MYERALTTSERQYYAEVSNGDGATGHVDNTNSVRRWACFSLESVTPANNKRPEAVCSPSKIVQPFDNQVYEFNRLKADAKCLDFRMRYYDAGEFWGVDDAENCAKNCVEYPASSTIAKLVGIEYACQSFICFW